MRPDRMRLPLEPSRLRELKNLHLITDFGQIDFLGDLPGVGSFGDLDAHIINLDLGGVICPIIDLDTLIASKRAAGRTEAFT